MVSLDDLDKEPDFCKSAEMWFWQSYRPGQANTDKKFIIRIVYYDRIPVRWPLTTCIEEYDGGETKRKYFRTKKAALKAYGRAIVKFTREYFQC